MTNNILFINTSWEQEALVKTIYDKGFNIFGISKNAPSYLSLLKKHISCDIDDLSTIIKIVKLYEIDSIISDNCDYSLLSSEIISDLMHLPMLSLEGAKISNNKFLQRKIIEKHNIKQPKYKLIEDFEDIKNFRKLINDKTLIKPIDSRGSIGITFLDIESKEDEISNAVALALDNSPSKKCLIEEYISGELLTIDGFLNKNFCLPVAIANRERVSNGLILTNKIIYNSKINKKLASKCISFLKSVANALDYKYGHIHCEALLDKNNDLFLVECTNRGAGVFTSSIINPYVSGLDLNNFLLKIKTSSNLSLTNIKSENFEQKDASLIFPSLGGSNKIIYSYDYQKILELENVLSFRLLSKLGRPLPTPKDGLSRHFAISLATSNEQEINETIEFIISNCFNIR